MKTIGNSSYIHRLSVGNLGVPRVYINAFIDALNSIGFRDWEIVKWNKKSKKLTAIKTEEWNEAYEPELLRLALYDCRRKRIRELETKGQIYHHKWMFVDETYPFFDIEESKARTEWINTVVANHPDYDNKKIGNKVYWEKLLNDVEPFEYNKDDTTQDTPEMA